MFKMLINQTQLQQLLSPDGSPVHSTTIVEMEKNGQLPVCKKIGHSKLWTIHSIAEWLEVPDEVVQSAIDKIKQNKKGA